ncbi:N-glycosyltransferase [compost metagenome]
MFLVLGLLAVVILTCGLVAGSVADDLHDVRQRQLFKKHPYSRQYRARPLVTILLITSNEIATTRDSLRRLQKNSYRHIELILVGNLPSRTKLKQLAQSFTTPTRPIYVFTSRKSGQANIDTAYRRYGHGDIILVLRDVDALDKSATARSVWHFNTKKDISKLRTQTVISSPYSTLGILQTYTHAVIYFWHKLANALKYTAPPDNPTPSFYRAETFSKRQSKSEMVTYTAEDVIIHRPAMTIRELVAYTQTAASTPLYHFTNLRESKPIPLKWLRGLVAIVVGYLSISLPFLLSYFIFLALTARQPALLFVSIATLSVYVLLGVWSHHGLSRAQKIRLSIYCPAYFLPFYLLTIASSILIISTTGHGIWKGLSRLFVPRRKVLLPKSAGEYD